MIKFALIRGSPQIFSLGCSRLSGYIVGIPGNDWLARVGVSRRRPVNGQESVGVPGSRGTISLLTLLSTSKIYIRAPHLSGTPSEKPVFNTQYPNPPPHASQCLVNRSAWGNCLHPASSHTLQLCSSYYCIIHGRRPGPASGASWTTGLSLRGCEGHSQDTMISSHG